MPAIFLVINRNAPTLFGTLGQLVLCAVVNAGILGIMAAGVALGLRAAGAL